MREGSNSEVPGFPTAGDYSLTEVRVGPIVDVFRHACWNEAVSHAEWLRVTGP